MNRRYRERYAAKPERFRAKGRRTYQRLTAEQKARVIARAAERHYANHELAERHRATNRRRYHANKETIGARNRQWYAANAERQRKEALKRAKRQRAEHAAYYLARRRAATQARRARQRRVFVEDVDPLTVFTRDQGICGLCALSVDPAERWHVDHVIPLSKGGEHSYQNVQLTHAFCNQSKGNRSAPLRRVG